MKVLVTGGAGFIGSHVVDALINKGDTVFVVDNLVTGTKQNVNAKAHFSNIDVCDQGIESIFQLGIDNVIHLAAQIDISTSIQNPLYDAKVNILGGLTILENCKKYHVKKVIYANSAAEIGDLRYIPVDEQHPLHPLSPYGVSKLTMHYYLQVYAQLYNLNFTTLRFANVYGPRQGNVGEGGVVSIFIQKLLHHEVPVIFGDGWQTRDFIYVGDVVDAIVLALEKGSNTCYNVGTGKEISVHELFRLLCDLTGKEAAPKYQEARKGEILRNVFSIEKIKKELEWFPKITLREGLQKTIASSQITPSKPHSSKIHFGK
ncbi:NAD-dependent epimerase/dehydratase family protein [Candidatus Woesearchaeota archaeon]|nr:NAD-dependent epimerase/dehydratase family protein [Candidatus Woesearchaeota archaeon]